MNLKLRNLELVSENARLKDQNLELITIAKAHTETLINAKNMLEEMLNKTGELFMESEALQKALSKKDYIKEDEPYENLNGP